MRPSYPTVAQVEEADLEQLVRWQRLLPSPDDSQRPAMQRIVDRLAECKRANPGAFTEASKAVGW